MSDPKPPPPRRPQRGRSRWDEVRERLEEGLGGVIDGLFPPVEPELIPIPVRSPRRR